MATLMCTVFAGRARCGSTDSTARRPVGPWGGSRFNRLRAADWAGAGRLNRPRSAGSAGPVCRLDRLGPALPEASRRPGRPPGPLRPAASRFDRDGAAAPRPDDGAIRSRSLRALFASPIRRRGRTKNSAARVLLPHNVQVATVTPDYSGPQYIATSFSSRTLSRPEPAHAHLCTTLSTPLPRCAVWRRERTRKLPPQPCNRTTAKAQECGHTNSAPVDDADLRTGRASARASIIRALATRHRVHVLCACCRTVSLHAMYYHSST